MTEGSSEQKDFDRRSESGGESTPKPDPTDRTTGALLREIDGLRNILDQRISATEELFEQKILSGIQGGLALKELFTAKLETSEQDRLSLHEEIRDGIKTLREFMIAAIEANDKLTASQLADLREVLNERYQTQTKALDAAFVAQQTAVATSFDAQRELTANQILAAKEAVEKANVAAEKRFDALNELVAQVSSSANQLLPRGEADARFMAIDARVADIKTTVDKGFTGVDAHQSAGRDTHVDNRANIAIAIAVVLPLLTMLTMILISMRH